MHCQQDLREATPFPSAPQRSCAGTLVSRLEQELCGNYERDCYRRLNVYQTWNPRNRIPGQPRQPPPAPIQKMGGENSLFRRSEWVFHLLEGLMASFLFGFAVL